MQHFQDWYFLASMTGESTVVLYTNLQLNYKLITLSVHCGISYSIVLPILCISICTQQTGSTRHCHFLVPAHVDTESADSREHTCLCCHLFLITIVTSNFGCRLLVILWYPTRSHRVLLPRKFITVISYYYCNRILGIWLYNLTKILLLLYILGGNNRCIPMAEHQIMTVWLISHNTSFEKLLIWL